jgi:hypothetical protein
VDVKGPEMGELCMRITGVGSLWRGVEVEGVDLIESSGWIESTGRTLLNAIGPASAMHHCKGCDKSRYATY